MDSDKIPDSDCDPSGFDPELMRAYEEWADDYFGQVWRGLRITLTGAHAGSNAASALSVTNGKILGCSLEQFFEREQHTQSRVPHVA